MTMLGERIKKFSLPKLFIKTTNSISDERVRISIFYPRALWQIKSGTMMDRIILSNQIPTHPFLSVSQLQIQQFVAQVPSSYIATYISLISFNNPFFCCESRKYSSLTHQKYKQLCSQILQVRK